MGPLASTRKMCPPAVMDQENRFLRALETVRSARVEHDLLYLQGANGQTVLRLSRCAMSTGSSPHDAARRTPGRGRCR
jgi:heat shock protein HslJ